MGCTILAVALLIGVIGDMDHNTVLDFDDIDAFVLGLSDPATYETIYHVSPDVNGDCNLNNVFDFDDLSCFIDTLNGTRHTPEPSTAILAILAVCGLLAVTRKRMLLLLLFYLMVPSSVMGVDVWLSEFGSTDGTAVRSNPVIHVDPSNPDPLSVFVWMRPDVDVGIESFRLTLISTQDAPLFFSHVPMPNPDYSTGETRWEESTVNRGVIPFSDPDQARNMGISSYDPVWGSSIHSLGLSSYTQPLDPLYDVVVDGYMVAELVYYAVMEGDTILQLQDVSMTGGSIDENGAYTSTTNLSDFTLGSATVHSEIMPVTEPTMCVLLGIIFCCSFFGMRILV